MKLTVWSVSQVLPPTLARVSHHDSILQAALTLFAHRGIDATSLVDIAEKAETSKANVLYHFGSKDNLVGACLEPSVAELRSMAAGFSNRGLADRESRLEFVDRFVDVLINHRLAIHVIVTHPYRAESTPVLAAAHAVMREMAVLVATHTSGPEDRVRFGIAVSGATYALVSAGVIGAETPDDAEIRETLRHVLSEIVSPQSVERI